MEYPPRIYKLYGFSSTYKICASYKPEKTVTRILNSFRGTINQSLYIHERERKREHRKPVTSILAQIYDWQQKYKITIFNLSKAVLKPFNLKI